MSKTRVVREKVYTDHASTDKIKSISALLKTNYLKGLLYNLFDTFIAGNIF